jgi:hypothetical protein
MQDFDVEAVAAHPQAREEIDGRIALEQLKAALCVGDTGDCGGLNNESFDPSSTTITSALRQSRARNSCRLRSVRGSRADSLYAGMTIVNMGPIGCEGPGLAAQRQEQHHPEIRTVFVRYFDIEDTPRAV